MLFRSLYVTDNFIVPLGSTATYPDSIFATAHTADGKDALLNHSVIARLSVVDCSSDVETSPGSSWSIVTNGKWLQIIGRDAAPVQLELVDLQGKTLLSTTSRVSAPIDVSALPAGIYLYRLQAGTQRMSGKIELP